MPTPRTLMTSEQLTAVSYCARTTYTAEKEHARLTASELGRPSLMALMGMRDAVLAFDLVWRRPDPSRTQQPNGDPK